MKLPLSIAEKLRLLLQGNTIPAAQMRHGSVDKMLEDGILLKQRTGANRNIYHLNKQAGLAAYLHNNFGISSLEDYINGYGEENLTRSESVRIASDSKWRKQRTFKGFLVNSFEPVSTHLNGKELIIHPEPGTFRFIADFETFIPARDVIIVGIENPENFRYIREQAHLFEGRKILCLSRYPQSQSGDVIRWLQMIPNAYLHFGDFDFAGINIYLGEYKKHLKERAGFFLPGAIEDLIISNGSRDLYNKQLHLQPGTEAIEDAAVIRLVALLHQHKKGLEQEALIGI